jgi:hypothetical protein
VTLPINIEALLPVADAFERLGIEYFIGGSIASSYHGIARSTIDIDIVANIESEHVDALAAQLESKYYVEPHTIYNAIRDRKSFNIIHFQTSYKVDIFIPGRRMIDWEARGRIVYGVLPGEPDRRFPIASAEDVILNKLKWYRAGGEVSERQWLDLIGVMKVQGDHLDGAYLDRWAAELGVADLLQRARDEVRRVMGE